jgi:RNA polymerase sigma-70 factor (ECF subfamily)
VDEQQIVDGFLHGEPWAYELLFERYTPLVRRVAYRFVQDESRLNDVVQDVFVKFYQAHRSYRPTAKLSTYLYRITVNHCLNALRDERRRKTVTVLDELPDGSIPAMEAEKKALQEAVQQAIDRLPKRQRTALILKQYENLSYAEIAQVIGCTESAVDTLLQRAKKTLQKSLSIYL